MKRPQLLFVLFVFTIISASLSCSKNKNTQTPVQTVSWSGLRSTPQTYTVMAGRDTVLMGQDSTVMHFYPNSFMLANGSIIATGSISIQLIEMYTPGIMIANGATTTNASDSTMLQSGGQVYIRATMNGQEVFANKYGLGFRQPGYSSQPMELFYGSAGSTDSTTQWTISDTSKHGTTAPGTTADSSTSTSTNPHPNFMYIFDSCTSFNWVNCDQYAGNGAEDKLFIQLPDDSYSDANTVVFLALPVANSVEQGISDGPGRYLVTHIAGGITYKAIAITNKNNVYYYCELTGTTTTSHTVTTVPMAMAPETLGDIIDRLHGL